MHFLINIHSNIELYEFLANIFPNLFPISLLFYVTEMTCIFRANEYKSAYCAAALCDPFDFILVWTMTSKPNRLTFHPVIAAAETCCVLTHGESCVSAVKAESWICWWKFSYTARAAAAAMPPSETRRATNAEEARQSGSDSSLNTNCALPPSFLYFVRNPGLDILNHDALN